MPVRGVCRLTYACPGYCRCNQIDACPGCTLKPVPVGVDKTDACPGVILQTVPGGNVRNYCHL